MAVGFSNTNKPFNPRAQDQSPKGYNRAKLYSGKALSFDGVNDLVTMPTALTSSLSTTSVTFVTNVKTDFATWAGTRDDAFSFAERGMILAFNGGNIYYYYRHQSSGWRNLQVPNADFKPQEWNQMVTTIDLNTNTWKAYVNGVEVATSGTYSDTAIAYDANALTIGGQAGARFFDGQIAGFKIFNTALTAAQVADLYNNPEKVVPTGVSNTALKLWLPMMEGAGTTAYDGSGNGNHGTISGATYVNGVGSPVAQSAVMDWNKGNNIFEHSEEFNDSYWTKARVLITANDITAPDGQTTADKALENSTTGYRDFGYKAITVTSGQPYTLSAYVKNGLGRDNAYLYTADSSRMAKFNIATGTYIGSASGNGYNAWDSYGITDAGNGWYRIHATLNSSIGGSKTYHLGFAENTDDVVTPYTGDTSKGLYAWGMQLEQASSVGPYVRTGDTNQPTPVLLPQGLTTGRDITGVNLFENVRKQGALNLDGNSWAEVHDNASFDFGTAVSLEAWVYWQGDNDDDGIIGRYGSTIAERDCTLYAYSGGIQFYVTANAVSYTSMTNGWRHIVGTYDGANKRLYVDGAQVNSSAETSTMPGGSIPVEIGRYNESASTTFTQPIAQPRIYNRALTASEVLQNYNSGKNTYK